MNAELEGSEAGVSEDGSGHHGLYYGWVVVGASVLIMAGFLAAPLCFGLFINPLEAEFGWSRAAISGAMSLSMAFSGLTGVLMGRVSDKYNMGVVVGIGMVVGTGSYFLLRTTESLWQLYLYFGVGVGICAGCGYAPVTATVSKWFTKKRTLAIGVALLGIILGQMALAPLVSAVIGPDDHWRTGYLALAILTIGLSLPGAIIMARKPKGKAKGPQPTIDPTSRERPSLSGYRTSEAARTAPFWMLMVTGFTMSAGFYVIMTHIVPCATELGVSDGAAALIITLQGAGSIFGTLLAGWFALRMGGRRAFLVLLLGQAASLLLFVFTRDVWSFYAVIVFYGLWFGAAIPTRMGMVVPLFGIRSIGAILGWASLAWSFGGVVSPYFSGYIHDVAGGYTWAFVAGCLLVMVGFASVYFWGSHKQETAAEG